MELAPLIVSHWNIVFTLALFILLILACVYSASTHAFDTRQWLLAAALSVLVTASQFVKHPIFRVLMLDAAAFIAVALVWLQNKKAGQLFFFTALGGSVLVAAGLYLGGEFNATRVEPSTIWMTRAAVFLLMLGFAIKLALIPFYFWLPPLAENTSPITAVLVISVIDMVEVAELAFLSPWIFSTGRPVWIALAVITMLGGALLALAQKDLRRMLAFSAIDDSGYLLLGIISVSVIGKEGVLIGILSHAFCKFLLFASLGVAETGTGKKITLANRGLAALYPVSAAAFIVGALGMVGVPPFLGAAARWRLYLAGINLGGPILGLAMAVASILALLYYVRCIHRVWLGNSTNMPSPKVSRPVNIVLVITMLLVVLSGLVLTFGASL